MPRPIPVLGRTQVDPTLPNIVKLPLYQHDEYQTYSLIELVPVEASYGEPDEISTTEDVTPIGDSGLKRMDDSSIPESYEETITRIEKKNGFKEISKPAKFLMQYYSPDGYPFCEQYFNKLHQLYENFAFVANIVEGEEIVNGGSIEGFRATFLGVNWTWALFQQGLTDPVLAARFFQQWAGQSIFLPDTNSEGEAIIREYPLFNGYWMVPDKVTYYYITQGILRYTGKFNFNIESLLGNSHQTDAIFYNIFAQESTSISVTYYYDDGLCRKWEAKTYSRGYRLISLSKGQNIGSIVIGQRILLFSVTVTVLTGDTQAQGQLESAIDAISDRLLFTRFDQYIEGFLRIESSVITPTHTIPCINPLRVFHANNNYWDNGIYPQDLGMEIHEYPQLSLFQIDNVYYRKSHDDFYGDDMPDSVRVQEIHAALEAQKFAVNQATGSARIANIGYYVERIARVLGISVDAAGRIKSIRQAKRVKPGETIPPGWDFGQFGTNMTGIPGGQQGGNPGELRDGIVYEQRSNKLIPDDLRTGQSKIEPGDYVLCENIPQMLSVMLDDLDKALSWQEIAAGGIPAGDGSGKVMLYEGMGSVVAELAFMLSRMSVHTSQTYIATRINQGITMEILQALGVGIQDKITGLAPPVNGNQLEAAYPGFDHTTPTITQQIGWLLQNIGILVANQITYDETEIKLSKK